MDHSQLQFLINCYHTSQSLVLIMNLRWEILWSNKPHSVDRLPELLNISPNHAANSTHIFTMDGIPHQCRILCNLQDGFRIAEIEPSSQPMRTVLTANSDTLTKAVQAISSACSALSASFHELDLDLQYEHDYLNIIAGNCYSLYRTTFLQKEIDRLQNNCRRKEYFCVQHTMRTLYQQMRNILRRRIRMELECCEDMLFLNGDMDELVIAVLSAAILCIYGSAHVQKLTLSLERLEGGMAELKLTSEKTAEEIPPSSHYEQDEMCFEGEETLIQLFCQRHNGRWLYTASPDGQSRICSLQFRTEDTNRDSLTLHSSRDKQEDAFFSKYRIMLSCIQYQNIY